MLAGSTEWTSQPPVTKTSCYDHMEIMSQAYDSKGAGSKGLMDNKLIKRMASKVEHGCGTLPMLVEAERVKTNKKIWEFKHRKES
jgi:hypothetical protein